MEPTSPLKTILSSPLKNVPAVPTPDWSTPANSMGPPSTVIFFQKLTILKKLNFFFNFTIEKLIRNFYKIFRNNFRLMSCPNQTRIRS